MKVYEHTRSKREVLRNVEWENGATLCTIYIHIFGARGGDFMY